MRARRIFVGGWGSLDPKENVSIPVRPGNLLGDGREGFVTLPVPFKALRRHGDDVRGVLPLAYHLGSGFDFSGNTGNIGTAATHGFGDLTKASLGGIRETAIGFNLHLVRDGSRQEIAAQGLRRRVAIERFPAVAQLGEAEVRQAPDLSLKGLMSMSFLRHDLDSSGAANFGRGLSGFGTIPPCALYLFGLQRQLQPLADRSRKKTPNRMRLPSGSLDQIIECGAPGPSQQFDDAVLLGSDRPLPLDVGLRF
jgi:hypothetical protein